MGEEFVTIARVGGTHGRRGEVTAELHTDFPERFEDRKRLFALAGNGSRRKLELESYWPHKGRIVLKFAGVESILEAESLVGCELQILASQRARLETDSAYVSDLVGCAVWDLDRQIGRVSDVRFGAGEAPLLVISGGAQQYEIPFAKAFLEKLDLADKQIRMRLPQGMLEVNAPLTDEEKKRQKEGS